MIVVESPPAAATGPVDVKVEVNSVQSTGTTFTYDNNNVVLANNDVSSASPVLKTPGILTGTGFGTVKKDLDVILIPVDATKNQQYTLLVQ